jgi:hypothetical protein
MPMTTCVCARILAHACTTTHADDGDDDDDDDDDGAQW